MGDKPRLSPSKVDSYQQCGYAWYRYNILGDRRQPGIFLLRGRGVHKGAEHNFSQKMDTHVDVPKKEIVDVAVAEFEQTVEMEGVGLTPLEAKRGKALVLGDAIDQTARMAGIHADQQAPEYQPVLVEQYVRIPLEHSTHDLSGVIDLLDDKWQVRDFKTASRRKSQKDADTSFQLQFYDLATYVHTGRRAVNVGLDVMIETRSGKTDRQVLTTVPEPGDFRAMVARANAVIDGIDKGVFPPAPVGSWKCSAKWCGYAATDSCPYYVPERDPDSDKYAYGNDKQVVKISK